jgi:hypothetical protein
VVVAADDGHEERRHLVIARDPEEPLAIPLDPLRATARGGGAYGRLTQEDRLLAASFHQGGV